MLTPGLQPPEELLFKKKCRITISTQGLWLLNLDYSYPLLPSFTGVFKSSLVISVALKTTHLKNKPKKKKGQNGKQSKYPSINSDDLSGE